MVAERLDTRHHLNPERVGIIVHAPDVRLGVSAAHIAEIRVSLDLIGILRVEHEKIHAEQRHIPDQPHDGLRLFHGVPGSVEHETVCPERRFFLDVTADAFARDMGQRTENLDLFGIDDPAAGRCELRDQFFALPHGHRNAVGGQCEGQDRRGLLDTAGQLCRNASEMKGKCLHGMPRLCEI